MVDRGALDAGGAGAGGSGGGDGEDEAPDPINIGGDVDPDGGGSPGGTRTDLDATEPVDEQLGGGLDELADSATDTAGNVVGAAADVERDIAASPVGSRLPADAVTGTLGPAADEIGDAVGQRAGTIAQLSDDAADAAVENVVEPAAENVALAGTGFGPGEADFTGTDNQATQQFVESAGEGIAQRTLGFPRDVVQLGTAGAAAAEATAENIDEADSVVAGTAESAATGTRLAVEAGGRAADQATEQAKENPAATAGAVFGNTVGGLAAATGAIRGTERLARGTRGAARTRGTGDTVAFEDITSERGAAGELPEFRTDPDAPTEQAVREVETRARDTPDTLQEDLGEQVTFRSESDRLPDDLEAQPGASELPGLFTSPDASPLRATVGGDSGGLRLPFTGGATRPETFSAFETEDVRGIPDRAAGSGRVGGPDPGLDTPGGRFLAGEAERGPAFVRPSGDRTTELEGIFPPGTAFERVGSRRLSGVGGGTIDLFRRAPDRDRSDLDLDQPPRQRGDGDRELFTGSEIRSRERRSRDDETPVSPPAGVGSGSSAAARSTGSGGSSPFSDVSGSGGSSFSDSGGGSSGSGGSPFSGGSGGGGSSGSGSSSFSDSGGGSSGAGGSPFSGGSGGGGSSGSGSSSFSDSGGGSSGPGSSPFSDSGGGGGSTGGGSGGSTGGLLSGNSGGGSSSPRPPTFEDEDDDDPFDTPTGSEAAEEFTNPVASASEVLSSDADPGGQTPETGNDGPAETGLFGGDRR